MIIKYNVITNEILGYYTGDIEDIEVLENEAVREMDVTDCSQKDIRAFNEDCTVKTLGQQIKSGILKLGKDEVIKYDCVVKLNPAYEEDKIRLVQRGLYVLDEELKIEYNENEKKYFIVEKNLEDKLVDEVITPEEYLKEKNQRIIQQHVMGYNSELCLKIYELIESVFMQLSADGVLTFDETNLLREIRAERRELTEKYRKMDLREVVSLKSRMKKERNSAKRYVK